ncbi:DUF2663 family protein [Bacillus sp. Marseille-P3661]|uniref:DUF2663 family protein n=1 Tax=Bacillus sp. Marseille-P3661 TaxID=1936234 RepID=UPI000C818B0B|nr:DUF2663 family protein [Bacillus sp. Marseille-P3661]
MKGYYLDSVGMVIIDELKDLRRKLDKREKDVLIYNWIYFCIAVGFLGYLTIYTFIPYWNQYNLMVSNLINNSYHYFFIVIIVTIYQRLKFVKKETDKAEKEYNNLRCEVIRRLEELWPKEYGWEQRHLFIKEIKEKFDINLYYEN